MTKKVLMVTRSFDHHIGGMETHTRAVGEYLSTKGYDVTVLTAPVAAESVPRMSVPALTVVRTNARPSKLLKYSIGFWHEVRDFVQKHGRDYASLVNISMAAAAIPHAWKQQPGFPKVVTILHGCYRAARAAAIDRIWHNPCDVMAFGALPYCIVMERCIEQRIIRVSDVIVSVSDTVHACVTTQYPDARPKCRVIRNGVDVAAFPFVQRNFRDRLTFLYIGRLHREKGLDRILDTFAVVRDPRVQVLIVGEGSEKERLCRDMQRRNLHHIQVHDAVAHRDVSQILQQASVLLFPSRCLSEGLPLSVLEGMATGLPVITTNIPALQPIISDGDNGYVIPVGSVEGMITRVRYCLDHPELLEKIAVRARETIVAHHNQATNFAVLDTEILP